MLNLTTGELTSPAAQGRNTSSGTSNMDLNALDLKRLRAFHLVAKHGNLRLAAARLNQTIPAISDKIRRLERDLGIQLFERLPNKLILTGAGKTFSGEVEAIFLRAEQALATISHNVSPSGRLTVSTGSDYSWYIAPRISRLLKKHPGVELDLQVQRSADAIRALARGDLDVAVGIFPKLPKSIQRTVLAETTLSLVCPHGHPMLQHRPLRPADIARFKLIVLPRHGVTRKLVDKTMAEHGLRASSVIEVANCQTASTFVETGVGVAIAHSLCLMHGHSEKTALIDLGKYFGKVTLSAAFRRGAHSELIRALLDELT
jgi:DNA-binding transcriptional LysR family regulator